MENNKQSTPTPQHITFNPDHLEVWEMTRAYKQTVRYTLILSYTRKYE